MGFTVHTVWTARTAQTACNGVGVLWEREREREREREIVYFQFIFHHWYFQKLDYLVSKRVNLVPPSTRQLSWWPMALHPDLRPTWYSWGQVWCLRHSRGLMFKFPVSIHLKGKFRFYVRDGNSGAGAIRVCCHQTVSSDDDS